MRLQQRVAHRATEVVLVLNKLLDFMRAVLYIVPQLIQTPLKKVGDERRTSSVLKLLLLLWWWL